MKAWIFLLLTALTISTVSPVFSKTQPLSASNPIAWKLDRTFSVPILVGRSTTINYTLTNNLPFTLAHPLIITNSGSPSSEFTYDDQCTGKRLGSQASCTVAITLTPLSVGTKFYQLTIGGYDNNKVPLPEITTIASGSIQTGVTGVPTHSLPYSLNLGSLGSYEITFTNYDQSSAATNLVPVVTATGATLGTVNTTCGTSITTLNAQNPSCTVSGTYTPNSVTPSLQTIAATLTFAGSSGSPAVATTYTNVQSGQTGDLIGTIVPNFFLPPVMLQGGTYPLEFLFTNVSSSQLNFSGSQVGNVTCNDGSGSGSCNGQISAFTSNCTTSLPSTVPSAACQLTATFTAPTASSPVKTYTITASVPYTNGSPSPATVITAGTVVASLPTTRTITVINQCTFPVWFSLNGAALAGYNDSNCPPGTSAGPSNTCFWNNPVPLSPAGNYQLALGGGQNTVTIPAYNYGGVQWSGNISASTLCTPGVSCVQADCDNSGGNTGCAVGQGFSQPATQAEITMNVSAADSYDVEVINGFHIPISMQPVYYQSGGTTIPANWSNYNCGTAGSLTAQQNFGACNWSASTVAVPEPVGGTGKSSGYYWVPINGATCDITSPADQCNTSTTGQVCGLSINRTNNTIAPMCGLFLGYWSADQICSYSGLSTTISNFFHCTQALPTTGNTQFPANATLYDLMRCKVPSQDVNPLYNSCYLTYSNSYTADQINTCCGCVDWWNPNQTPGATIISNDTTQSCGTQIDPQWTTYVQPMIQWMKSACPTAYTYPFDDKSSSFGCTNNLPNAANSVGYTITFCDGGNTGLPNGISPTHDGR